MAPKAAAPKKKKKPSKAGLDSQIPAGRALDVAEGRVSPGASEDTTLLSSSTVEGAQETGEASSQMGVLTFKLHKASTSESIGVSLMELPATPAMPARLMVTNCAKHGLAARAGLQTYDELKSINGHDVATALGCSKRQADAVLGDASGDVEIVVLRTRTRREGANRPPRDVFADAERARGPTTPAAPVLLTSTPGGVASAAAATGKPAAAPLARQPTLDVVIKG